MLLNCGVGEDSWESLGLQGDPKGNQSWIFIRRTDAEAETLILMATWCKEMTHLKRPWCWEWLKVGGEGDDRGWDGWMTSLTQWMWVWVDSGSWWWTGSPGVLPSTELQRVGHDWATELNWVLLNGDSSDNGRKLFNCSLSSAKFFMNLVLFLSACWSSSTSLNARVPACIIVGTEYPRFQTSSLLIWLSCSFSWS